MNEPIISPWIFYIADVIKALNMVAAVLLVISLCGAVILWSTYYVSLPDLQNRVKRAYHKFNLKELLSSDNVDKEKISIVLSYLHDDTVPVLEILRWAKLSTALLVLSVLLLLVVPSKDTYYKIVVAKYVTPATVTKTLDVGNTVHKELKKDILDIIDHIKASDVTKQKTKSPKDSR